MKKKFAILTAVFSITLAGCLEDWLVTTPQTILTDEQVYNDVALIEGLLADYYDRLPFNPQSMGIASNGFFGNRLTYLEALGQSPNLGNPANGGVGGNNAVAWAGNGNIWGLLRDIHVAIAGVEGATNSVVVGSRPAILAELRFLRAMWYFIYARSYGGMPILTEQLIYDFVDLTSVQVPRATEEETYDFILDELDAIMDQLGNAGSYTRANKAAALALKSRVALYAASTARYNNEMIEPLTTPGGEAGIPASRAAGYFEESLDASLALISGSGGSYSLVTGADPSAAFASIFVNKGNSEVILAKDFHVSKRNDYTLVIAPPSFGGASNSNWGQGTVSPSLNLLENFDRLDGSSGSMIGRGVADIGLHAAGNTMQGTEWTYFDNIDDIFDGYDGRMKGTIMVPGGVWYGDGGSPELLAGVYRWNASANRYDRITTGGVVGFDGPIDGTAHYQSGTGFAMQKSLDPAGAARTLSPGGTTMEIWFRLGEIYLNAAEAAFELGRTSDALGYLNTLRQRAGFGPNSLTIADLSREKIRSERWSELAFEGQYWFDHRRWRTADTRWDGDEGNPHTRLYVLFPYRIERPGHANDGKYVFTRFRSVLSTSSATFNLSNYYADIPQNARNANPALECNPLQSGC